jgi:hypothetical protein
LVVSSRKRKADSSLEEVEPITQLKEVVSNSLEAEPETASTKKRKRKKIEIKTLPTSSNRSVFLNSLPKLVRVCGR